MSWIPLRVCSRNLITILFITQWIISSPAHALSPMKVDGESTIRFDPGSSTLSEDAKTSLATHLSCIASIFLEAILVVAYGDAEVLSEADQLRVAAKRSTEIRAFLVNAGVPDEKIYSELRVKKSGDLESGRLTGVAVLNSFGNCRRIEPRRDCRILCRRDR